MNKRRVDRRVVTKAAAAMVLSALGAMGAMTVKAEIGEDQIGNVSCFRNPLRTPGLQGLPQWPVGAGAKANTDGDESTWPGEATRQRHDIDDPRWGNAPLSP